MPLWAASYTQKFCGNVHKSARLCQFVGVPVRPSHTARSLKSDDAERPSERARKTAAKTVIRRKPRRHKATPIRGLSLLASGADRLGLWPQLWEQWVCRTFALTLFACVPRLSNFARAEKLVDGTLTVVVTSSAVASELSFVRDLLLEHINRELLKAVGQLDSKHKRTVRPVLRLQHRVGRLQNLPDVSEWQERPKPPQKPSLPKITLETQLAVATASQELPDEDLRLLLLRLVGATTRAS